MATFSFKERLREHRFTNDRKLEVVEIVYSYNGIKLLTECFNKCIEVSWH